MSSTPVRDVDDYEDEDDESIPTTLEAMSEDSESEGSLKDFVVDSDVEDSSELRDESAAAAAACDVDLRNIIAGKRTRKPVQRITEASLLDNKHVQQWVTQKVDLDYYHETESKDLADVDDSEEDDETYEPGDSDNCSDEDDDDDEVYEEVSEDDDDYDDDDDEDDEEEEEVPAPAPVRRPRGRPPKLTSSRKK